MEPLQLLPVLGAKLGAPLLPQKPGHLCTAQKAVTGVPGVVTALGGALGQCAF